MWCKNCNIETNEEMCPICGEKTVEDYPTEVYWCDNCRVPVMQEVNQADKVNNVRSFCATRSESLGRMNVETGCSG